MAAAAAAHGAVEQDEPPEQVDFDSSDGEDDDDDLFHLFCSVAPPLPREVGGSDAAEELDRQLLDVLVPGLREELADRIGRSAVRAEIDEAHAAAAKEHLEEGERRLSQAQAALERDVRSALGLGDELGPAEAARLFDAGEGIERLPQGSKRLPERQHVCPRTECGCVESWYFADRARTVQYETTCAQVDRLWLAKQTGSRQMEEAKRSRQWRHSTRARATRRLSCLSARARSLRPPMVPLLPLVGRVTLRSVAWLATILWRSSRQSEWRERRQR